MTKQSKSKRIIKTVPGAPFQSPSFPSSSASPPSSPCRPPSATPPSSPYRPPSASPTYRPPSASPCRPPSVSPPSSSCRPPSVSPPSSPLSSPCRPPSASSSASPTYRPLSGRPSTSPSTLSEECRGCSALRREVDDLRRENDLIRQEASERWEILFTTFPPFPQLKEACPHAPTPTARPHAPTPTARPHAPTPTARPHAPTPTANSHAPTPTARPYAPTPTARPHAPTPPARPHVPTQPTRRTVPTPTPNAPELSPCLPHITRPRPRLTSTSIPTTSNPNQISNPAFWNLRPIDVPSHLIDADIPRLIRAQPNIDPIQEARKRAGATRKAVARDLFCCMFTLKETYNRTVNGALRHNKLPLDDVKMMLLNQTLDGMFPPTLPDGRKGVTVTINDANRHLWSRKLKNFDLPPFPTSP